MLAGTPGGPPRMPGGNPDIPGPAGPVALLVTVLVASVACGAYACHSE
jgi:hypothetical protein